jgi:hypothetical protein
MAFRHLLEIPAKMAYEGPLWLTLLKSLFWAFGTVGAFIEVGAVLMAMLLSFIVRRRRPAFDLTLIGAICLLAAHVAWWLWVFPVDTTMGQLTPEALPADWTRLRRHWEQTHTARAILQIIALGALVWSVLVETPTDYSR